MKAKSLFNQRFLRGIGRAASRFQVQRVVKKVLKFDRPVAGGFLGLMGPSGPRVVVAAFGHAFGVHSEHDLKEQSDAQIIVSRFPFRGEG